ncbi:MAG: hypothetical protein NTV32_07315 [Gammaproteobacteria bacterium]|nr:hypothetical protein [Gammaproteobacteria bacterium]
MILGDTGPNIEPEGGDFSSFLKKATAHPTQRFSILIQWDALTPKERLTLQEMLDDSPRIKGIPVAKNIQIIGLCQNRPEDESFQSRYKGEVYTLPLPLPQAPTDSKREETISSVIDLEGESNWLEKFFGRVILVENKMTFEPGPLFDGIGANQRITLLNIANDQQEAIQYACDIARAQGYFLYHGMMIPIAPTAQFDLSNRNLNFADFEIKQVFRNAPKRALPEAIVVNTHCVDILFQDKCIVEGIYSERPGLLERFRGQHLLLHVNRHSEASDLTESQWYTLFNRAKMYGISLSLYLEPGVSLPRNLTIESDLPADSADKDSISVKETSPSSPLVFNVEDECFSSLFYSVRFTSERAGFSDFAIELGGALSALLAGETVILKGIFSPELLDQLAPLSLSNHSFIIINGERVDFSGTLILQAETARSVPQSPSIIYSESDCSHEDVGTEADSKAFISRRKSALLGVLDQHHIARISGPTGVGKTSLIDEMAKLEQATLYQELDEFEAWALDTSEKIKILRIDEHNIENLHFTFLAPMLAERTPCVLYKGKTYELSETHKVVFAGNDLSYGGGRVSQKLFEDYSIPTLAFQDFPPCYIDHQILKPIFNKMSKIDLDICEAGLLEHDIHTEKTRLLALYYDKNQANPGSMTVRALQNEALQWCTARLLEFREASTTTDKPSSFIEAPYTTAAMTCLTNALIRKDLQREGLLPGQGLGLNGVIIEGMPGLGKSALVQHCLKSHPHIRIPANLLLEEHLHETLKIIATAFDEGKPVWIDEFDACSGEGVEKAINSFLTGRNINGQPAKKEGFLLIVTLNGAALSGRDILSPAFKARCEHVVINPLTASDIQEILEYKYPTDSPEIRAIMTNQFLSLQTSHGLTLRGLLHVLDQAHQGAPAVGGAGGGPISLFSQAPMASDYHTDPGAH